MDSTYVEKVRRWVALDNRVIRNKQEMASVLEERKELEDDILDYVETESLDGLTLSISDGSIKFAKRTSSSPLTLKSLRTILSGLFVEHDDEPSDAESEARKRRVVQALTSVGNEDAIDAIVDHVAANLTKKSVLTLKRDIRGSPPST